MNELLLIMSILFTVDSHVPKEALRVITECQYYIYHHENIYLNVVCKLSLIMILSKCTFLIYECNY